MARDVNVRPHRVATGIHHFSVLALDTERTVRFYVDVLGLRAVDQVKVDERSAAGRVWLGDGRSQVVTIIQSADGQEGEPGVGTIHHVGLAIASFDVLLKWKRWLQDNQILVYGPYDQMAYQDIIFADPDGVLLEIATTEPGWEAMQDGRDVYSPPKESMAPYRNEEDISSRTWPQRMTQIEPDMAIQGFHHVSTITSSLDATDRFYRDALGLPLVRKTLDPDDPEVELWHWGLDGGRPGTIITAFPIVHPHEGGKPVDGRSGVGVADHFALGVNMDDEALRRWSTDLSSRGLEVTPTSPDQVGSVCVRSPDGHIVELVAADQDSRD